jgi:hypothetical protein
MVFINYREHASSKKIPKNQKKNQKLKSQSRLCRSYIKCNLNGMGSSDIYQTEGFLLQEISLCQMLFFKFILLFVLIKEFIQNIV